MNYFRKICEFFTIVVVLSGVTFSVLEAQNYPQIPFVVYNSEKVFRNSELGQEIIRKYNKKVKRQVDAANTVAKQFEAEEQELVKKRKQLSTEEFKLLADDFDERVRKTRISHKNADKEIRKLYGTWKENFFNETIPKAFEPISKEYDVYAAVDLIGSKNLVYRDDIEVTKLFINEINRLYEKNKVIFDIIVEDKSER